MKKFFYSIPVSLILNILAVALCYYYWSFIAIVLLSIFMIFYTEKALSWRKSNRKGNVFTSIYHFHESLNNNIFDDAKDYISKHNKTDNAYHNNKHMIDVFNNSMTLFNECLFIDERYKKEFNLTPNDQLNLGLAALFHDFNHSGGKLKDDENIELALIALKEYLDLTNKSDLYNDVKHIIIATEFPHKDIKLDILQKIIRDADTMGGITEDWMSVVKSLAKELNKTFEEFIPSQINFLQSVKYNTDYCNQLLANNKEKILKELEQY